MLLVLTIAACPLPEGITLSVHQPKWKGIKILLLQLCAKPEASALCPALATNLAFSCHV